ncbi:MAG TPA: FecR domain-containing protein, partial [Parvularculaceae bacterium]|nr:FecR domain-containing protein [Parvularculaceae bacterium]
RGAVWLAAVGLWATGAEASRCFDHEETVTKAGTTTAVKGPDVGLKKEAASVFVRPAAGVDLFGGDSVKTGDASIMQIKLCDWSTYTFSPNSESAINEFYDAKGAESRRVVNFLRGGIHMLSGKDSEPTTDVKVSDTGVTMGVRGTGVIVVELDGVIYALLEGPGLDNSALQNPGLVEFTNDQENEILAKLYHPGFAVRINPDGTVSDPFRPDDALLKRIYAAFTPPVSPNDPNNPPLPDPGGSSEDLSGQGAQNGNEGAGSANNQNNQQNQNKDNYDPNNVNTPPPPTINVGDILPLGLLDFFAAAQTGSGHFIALVPATYKDASGNVIANGVALMQFNIDFSSRTFATEPLASFVKFDFSVTNPADLTIRNFTFIIPQEVRDAYLLAAETNAGFPFSTGQSGLAIFGGANYLPLVLRQAANNSITLDASASVSATDPKLGATTTEASASFIPLLPGDGELAYFDLDLGRIFSIAELTNFGSSGTTILHGFSNSIINTGSPLTPATGLVYGQLQIDFGNRTIGGGDSFLAIMQSALGANPVGVVLLNQAVSFNSGLFNLALYPLAQMTTNGSLVAGQAAVFNADGLGADIASIINTTTGDHLYSELFLNSSAVVGPDAALSTIAELDALAATVGSGAFHFDGVTSPGFASMTDASGGFFFGNATASIDISFANRTIGGGNSFLSASVTNPATNATFSFTDLLNAISFDAAAGGQGVFALDGEDFNGGNGSSIDSALFLIHSDDTGNAANTADLIFDFNDGAGGHGEGQIFGAPRAPGATPAPIP